MDTGKIGPCPCLVIADMFQTRHSKILEDTPKGCIRLSVCINNVYASCFEVRLESHKQKKNYVSISKTMEKRSTVNDNNINIVLNVLTKTKPSSKNNSVRLYE